MTEMTRERVKLLAEDVEAAVQEVAERWGLSVKYGGGNYAPTSAVLKFEFAVVAADGRVLSREAMDWAVHAPRFGLPKDGVGKQFATHNGVYQIEGWKPANTKYPILAKRTDGKQFKFDVWTVKRALARQEEEA